MPRVASLFLWAKGQTASGELALLASGPVEVRGLSRTLPGTVCCGRPAGQQGLGIALFTAPK